METLDKQPCPFCNTKNMKLIEDKQNIPYFGDVFIFSMDCSNCKYHKGDIECVERKDPCRLTFEISNEKDMKIRVVKSSEATLKIPQLRTSVTPGPGSDGYVSNIEGVLDRFKGIIEGQRDDSEDDNIKRHAKNLLKKLWKVKCGDIKLKIIIEDPSGNSAIISDKTKVEKLKK